MYNIPKGYPFSCFINTQTYNTSRGTHLDRTPRYNSNLGVPPNKLKDYGPRPFVINIEEATKQNNNFRTTLWTGKNLQVTVMSINVGDDIGLEVHQTGDQFIRIEEGQGIVKMGNSKDNLNFQKRIHDDSAIMIPAGIWHNVINTGNKPLKLYAIYAPPEHPRDTVHETKAAAEAAESRYRY